MSRRWQRVRLHAHNEQGRLTPASSWGSEDVIGEAGRPGAGTFERYVPPFEFTSDMLFTLALCATGTLRHAFPGIPFLSMRGKTPLVVWFSRVKEACSRNATGERRCEGGADAVLYNELTVIALLRRRAFFVPVIYATSVRSVHLARHYYGMPKGPAVMSVHVDGKQVQASMQASTRDSFVRARVLGRGTGLATILAPLWPLHVWPVRFPAHTEVRAVIEATPRVFIAHVQEGQLSLDAEWLPEAGQLLPFGLYLPRLRMRLPP